jgi:LacI family transcriptional regulator
MADQQRTGKRNGKATIVDVAREAGVSRATAARALGEYGNVSDASRKRVRAAAAALAYQPNSLARSMITGTTHTIGVVVADIENPFFAEAVRAISDAAHDAGFEVILANSDEDVGKERAAVAVLLQKQVDGLIVAPASSSAVQHLREVVETGRPLVLLDRAVPGLSVDAVVVDNAGAAAQAVGYLVAEGHRRIGIIGPSLSTKRGVARVRGRHTNPTEERLNGYLSALREGGVPVDENLVGRCRYDRASAAQATADLLALADPPTAVFATDATMALGVLDAAFAVGLCVPDDMSILVFDDPEWATVTRPPLTVVAQPVHELGAAATTRLLSRIRGGDEPREVLVLNTTFICRGSTAPPRAQPRHIKAPPAM